jgi:hypothetical protein
MKTRPIPALAARSSWDHRRSRRRDLTRSPNRSRTFLRTHQHRCVCYGIPLPIGYREHGMFYFLRIPVTRRRCIYCGNEWGIDLGYGRIRLGPEFLTCAACEKMTPTGMREWPTLSQEEQRAYVTAGRRTIIGGWLTCIAVLGLVSLEGREDPQLAAHFFTMGFLAITLLAAVPAVIMSIVRSSQIQESEHRFNTQQNKPSE